MTGSNCQSVRGTGYRTPKIPEPFRERAFDGWLNIFHLLPECTRLYGTETLFDNWNGEVLLLAKDAAPTGGIRRLNEGKRASEWAQVWRHASRDQGDRGGTRTNERLTALVADMAPRCLYGSVAAHLLRDEPGRKDTGSYSQSLPQLHDVDGRLHAHLKDVLYWVIDNMPNLRVIACLGGDSWRFTTNALGRPDISRRHAEHRDNSTSVEVSHKGRDIWLHALHHPAARLPVSAVETGWKHLRERVSGLVRPAVDRV